MLDRSQQLGPGSYERRDRRRDRGSVERCGRSERRRALPTGTFNWMTWGDHSYPAQLDAIAAANNIKANSTLFSDNIDAYTKLKQVGGQLDMVSGDALWVPHYFESGLIEAWDINSLKVAKQLYSIARSFPIWTKPEGYLGYPFGWSPVQIYYDPAKVSPAPDFVGGPARPEVQEAGRRGEPAGRDHGLHGQVHRAAKNAYSMTPDEIAKAKDAAQAAQAEHPQAGQPGHRHHRHAQDR